MTSDNEYALLAARAYFATQKNRVSIPSGWIEQDWIPDRSYGFSAGVYKKGNDIVIAFAGTNEAADWGWANVLVGSGGASPQVLEAMLLYITVKRENPGANITFTGHSLGGGLASLMAVFFDRPATVFDHAPFELGGRNLLTLAIYRAELAAMGFSDPAFNDYWMAAPAVFSQREAQVRSIFVEGEALEGGRLPFVTIAGPDVMAISPGSPAGVTSINLHSITLLGALMGSSRFANVIRSNPELLSLFFNEALYGTPRQATSSTS